MDRVKQVIKEELKNILPDQSTVKEVETKAKDFISKLNEEFRKEGIGVQLFIGGSFAKGTVVREETYDVDIFARFDWRYDNISDLLEKCLHKICYRLGYRTERMHGSRDYFRVYPGSESTYFEVIPVTKIKKTSEARNVTDLSYFHVSYIKKKARGLEKEIMLAKKFFRAQRVYGAESYVQGFSGYSLECLIIYFRSFEKMLKELSKVKPGERLVIDIEKNYKKNEIFFEMNEAKLHSPIILVDPTNKERNALASLSRETFQKFQKAAKDFLRRPSRKFFIKEEIDKSKLEKEAKKKKAEFLHVVLETDKQAGDIAGTKMRKFSEYLMRELNEYFIILKDEFEYSREQTADLYLIAKSRKEVVRIGPPLHMKKHVNKFKREHMDTYEKNKLIHARIKVKFDAKSYLDVWKKGNKKVMSDMGITKMNIR